MSITTNIQFHIGTTWRINFTLHNADGTAMDLTTTDVAFRLKTPTTIDKTIGSGIVITNAALGQGNITITPADQTTVAVKKNAVYPYEIKAEQDSPEFVSIQCDGNLTVKPSLFA